jgi:hypothetical protein
VLPVASVLTEAMEKDFIETFREAHKAAGLS